MASAEPVRQHCHQPSSPATGSKTTRQRRTGTRRVVSWYRKSPDLRCSARSRGTRSCLSRAWNCRTGSRLQLGTTWLGELLGVLARQQPGGKGSLRGNMDDQLAQYLDLGLGPVPLRSADLARILLSPAPQAPIVRHPASSTASLSTAEALRPTLTPAASPASELKPRHPLGPLPRGRRRRRTARPVPSVRAARLALPIAPRRCGRLRLPHPRCRAIFTVYERKRLGRERRRTRQPRHASPPRVGVAAARPFGRALSLPLIGRPCSQQDSRTVQGKHI